MKINNRPKELIHHLSDLYAREVLAVRTRRIRLLGRKCTPQSARSFLGYELTLGNKKILCPDMTTLRYLRIFGEAGFGEIEIPYDPTRTARLLPEFERIFSTLKRWNEESDGTVPLREVYRALRRAVHRKEAQARAG